MIIGLNGFISSGKNTVAKILIKQFNFFPMAFADHLKDITALMFGWERKLLEGDTDESRMFREHPDVFWSEAFGKPFTPRQALQLLGTESVRQVFHTDFWVISLKRKLALLSNGAAPNRIVITDCRFPNEIKAIRDMGGIYVLVDRSILPPWYSQAFELLQKYDPKPPPADVQSSLLKDDPTAHYSEWASLLVKPDEVIVNDGTVADLETTVSKFLLERMKSSVDIGE